MSWSWTNTAIIVLDLKKCTIPVSGFDKLTIHILKFDKHATLVAQEDKQKVILDGKCQICNPAKTST